MDLVLVGALVAVKIAALEVSVVEFQVDLFPAVIRTLVAYSVMTVMVLAG
jgi:hypothetical protein